jgi:hypothetical protein
VAQASTYLGKDWGLWVERLRGFQDLYERLLLNTPVIASVRGPLPGSAKPYLHGHLLVISGFDPERGEVLCMDPAFPTDEKTHIGYGLKDFLSAWKKRGNLAYIFQSPYQLTPIRQIL